MSLAVFICSISYTDHPSGELLHILFLAFILSRSQRWCSWCENTKGSRFIHHTTSTSDHPPCIPYLFFNVSGLWIPQCTVMHVSCCHRYSIATQGQKLYCAWLIYYYISFCFVFLIHTHTHAWGLPMMCAAGLWSESMLRKASASIDFSDLFSFLAHPHHWVHRYFLHSVMVTCKDTCGVADVVCSRWITSPEIDQPFCISLPRHPCIPIYLLYVSHCLTVSHCGLFLLSNKMDYTNAGWDCVELWICIKGHCHLMSSKD